MAGYPGRNEGSVGVRDDLMGRVLVMSNGDSHIALITLDVIGLDAAQVSEVRQGIEEATGISSDHVMISCSHTHSGPVMPSSDPRRDPFDSREQVPVPSRVDVLVDMLVGAAGQARKNMQEVSLRFLKGALVGWSQNRRRVAQGGVPIDPDVMGFVLTGKNGDPLSIVVNYTCHPTVMGGKNLLISADYPGAMARLVGSVFKGCSVLFINGACANINPNWFKLENNAFETVDRFGQALGGEVIRSVQSAIAMGEAERDTTLLGRCICDPLPLWPQPDGDGANEVLAAQRALLEKAKAGGFPKNPFPFWHSMTVDENLSVAGAESYVAWAETLARLAESNISVEAPGAEVQVLRIGRGGIASYPGEVFMELGLRVKEAFKDRPVMVAGYSNGSVGYIPTKEAFREGGYEVTSAQRASLIPISPEGGDLLTDQAIALLGEAFGVGRAG
jgi:hypothetical protein